MLLKHIGFVYARVINLIPIILGALPDNHFRGTEKLVFIFLVLHALDYLIYVDHGGDRVTDIVVYQYFEQLRVFVCYIDYLFTSDHFMGYGYH